VKKTSKAASILRIDEATSDYDREVFEPWAKPPAAWR
jgi:hypothetical protein